MHCPSQIILSPGEEFSESRRLWQGCPTIARSPGGVLYAGWYSGGSMEPSQHHFNVVVRSRDEGQTWSDPILVINSITSLQVRSIDIQLWTDPNQTLWCFWTCRDDNFDFRSPSHLSLWAIRCANPDDTTPAWSKPQFITHGFLRHRPTVLPNGAWVLCAYNWTDDRYHYQISRNQGKSWHTHRAGRKLQAFFDEAAIWQHQDGTLSLYARSACGNIAESVSYDQGRHWTDGAPTALPAPSSRFLIRRLASGRLLLIWNNAPDARRNLTAALSEDDGRTWPFQTVIDPGERITYPDATATPDGRIHGVYDHGRTMEREIHYFSLTEADILSARPPANRIISKLQEPDKGILDRQRALDRLYLDERGAAFPPMYGDQRFLRERYAKLAEQSPQVHIVTEPLNLDECKGLLSKGVRLLAIDSECPGLERCLTLASRYGGEHWLVGIRTPKSHQQLLEAYRAGALLVFDNRLPRLTKSINALAMLAVSV